MAEELQDVKLQVGLLQNEVEVRGRQIDALLSKLDTTADRKLLHSRIGNVHDEIGHSERRVTSQIHKLEERVRQVEQWKSRLMGMTSLVAGAIGAIAASIISWMTKT